MKMTLRNLMMGMMALTGVSALTSCSNDDEPQVAYKEGQQGYVEFTLTRGADTRTDYTFNEGTKGIDVTWRKGDKVVVSYNKGEIVEVFDIAEGAETKTAKFAKADSQLAEKKGSVTISYFPNYKDSKPISENFLDLSTQKGTLAEMGNYDMFSYEGTLLEGGKLSVSEDSCSPAMAILRFPKGLDFGTGTVTSDLVLSGGYNKVSIGSTPTEADKGDITVANVSLTDGKLSQDLYVAVAAAAKTPTSFKVGGKLFSLPNGFNPGKVYTLEQTNLKEIVPLTIEALADGTITIKNPLELKISYVKNGGDKVPQTTGFTINVKADDKVQFFGNNETYSDGTESNSTIIRSTAESKVYGNIMSLIKDTGYHELTELTKDYTFYKLFDGYGSKLADASGLLLPATTLTASCYNQMFRGCESLVKAPAELPAETLASGCYQSMFSGCTKLETTPELKAKKLADSSCKDMFNGCKTLVNAPELLATELADNCYYAMFKGCTALKKAPTELPVATAAYYCYYTMFSNCTSLETAPELKATTLAEYCYANMFEGCTSLVTAPELPADVVAERCYQSMFKGCTALKKAPTELRAKELIKCCYMNMFQDCTSLETAPKLPAETLASNCYANMFKGCSSLKTAPELPAKTLVDYCYNNMFQGCTQLNKVTCLATNLTSSWNYISNWLDGVAPSGTLTKAAGVDWPDKGQYYSIPSGWEYKDKEG